jgi:GGDEF domain-containing protein
MPLFAESLSKTYRRMAAAAFDEFTGFFAALALSQTLTGQSALVYPDAVLSVERQVTGVVEGKPVVATVSIGVVISYDAVLDLSALLAQADHALYRAKDNGGNRIEIASIKLILDRVKRASAAADRAASAKAAAKSAA